MKLKGTVAAKHENMYWQLHQQFKGNQNRMLEFLFQCALNLDRVLLTAQAKEEAARAQAEQVEGEPPKPVEETGTPGAEEKTPGGVPDQDQASVPVQERSSEGEAVAGGEEQ